MRYPATEKMEIIHLVEQSHLLGHKLINRIEFASIA